MILTHEYLFNFFPISNISHLKQVKYFTESNKLENLNNIFNYFY